MRIFQRPARVLPNLFKHYKYSTISKPINIKKSIYVSKSTDIFTNLAIEDWLYKNFDFTNHHILMMWQNSPCVVIGRHQNPWLESNFVELPNITEEGVKLARRNSGGGTVFHDLGNLNLTFFTSRECYNRKINLDLISKALNGAFDLNIELSQREDLVIGDKKISGTASKLGRSSAYHHCTLLVNANKENLSRALQNNIGEVKTNATRSVKSQIMNLSEKTEEICISKAMDVISNEYSPFSQRSFVDDEEITFPGVAEIKKLYLSYEWRFEKTPKFKICRTVHDLNDNLILEIEVEIDKGTLIEVYFLNKDNDTNISSCEGNGDFKKLFSELIGKKFCKEVLSEFEMLVEAVRHSELVIKDFIRLCPKTHSLTVMPPKSPSALVLEKINTHDEHWVPLHPLSKSGCSAKNPCIGNIMKFTADPLLL